MSASKGRALVAFFVAQNGCRLRSMLKRACDAFHASLDRHTPVSCAAGDLFAEITR